MTAIERLAVNPARKFTNVRVQHRGYVICFRVKPDGGLSGLVRVRIAGCNLRDPIYTTTSIALAEKWIGART